MTIEDNNIDERLNNLPRKIAAPFQQLLATGQLTEEVVSSVLDAGELAGDNSRLIGFAAGYMGLRMRGVPIHDVIYMAKNQNRKINLSWTPKRWKSEHDRLARSEALHRLTKENVEYNLSKFNAFLPETFKGYVIPNSRRLGMEGLRQRHCVASYHHRVKSGNCAIAAIFVNQQRWTVELIPTGNPDFPLRIGQIKTRFNESPSKEIRDSIHKMLNIDPKPKQVSGKTHAAEANENYMQTLRRLLPVLRESGVDEVEVSFDGSCDEGSINDITYLPYESSGVQRQPIQCIITNRNFIDGEWVWSTEEAEKSVENVLETLTYEYLVDTGVDWCNDEGGFGALNVNVDLGTVSFRVDTRYTESTPEYRAEHDIMTGQEIE